MHIQQIFRGLFLLTECSSESDVCEVMTGLKLDGEMGLSFFLMARICSSALKAAGGNLKADVSRYGRKLPVR